MEFLARALDGADPQPCGKCASCLGAPVVELSFTREAAISAARFLRHSEIALKCNGQVAKGAFAEYGFRGNLPEALRAETGRILSRWGDAGWGQLVADDKSNGHFRDALVDAVAEMIRNRWQPPPAPAWITCVPSRNHPALVSDFANRLANALALPLLPIVIKMEDNEPQKERQNRFHQCQNLDGVFGIEGEVPAEAVSFGKSDLTKAKPLSNNEWARFAIWLKGHDLEPASLLKGDLQTLLAGWIDRSVSMARLEQLMGRGTALGLSLEKWQRAGLWILTRSDPEYPERLKRCLRSESPAVLFGSGNKALLNKGSIAVVGSRDACEEDLAFTEMLGKEAATQGYSIVSGGARGVDQSAMLGALDIEGTAVGVLADSLLKSAMSAKYRKRIMSGDLVLTTPFNPEAGFNVGNAMSRNRYIYCLADAAVVISSTPDKGGTWNGALEDLKAGWVPLWVKHNTNTKSGNSALVQKGARWLPDNPISLATLLNGSQPSTAEEACQDLPLLADDAKRLRPSEPEMDATETPLPEVDAPEAPAQNVPTAEPAAVASPHQVDQDFHGLFLVRMLDITAAKPMKADDIASHLGLEKSQTNAWLKRGVSDGSIKKLAKPVRYQTAAAGRQQASLFGEN